MNLNSEKWMSKIADSINLCDITIPGTHNTCASKCSFLAKCQKISLMEQLNSGVRFIDIRCCHSDDEFKLHHGNFKIKYDFEHDVMDTCVQFLTSNPSETIIMLLKPEHKSKNNGTQFYEKFLSHVSKCKNFWYLNDTLPCLRDARGKIVLLRRFHSNVVPLGIDMSAWRDSATFDMQNHSDFKFFIQDEYNSWASDKCNSTMNAIKHAENSNKNEKIWHLNYASGSKWPLNPPVYIAYKVKKHLNNYLGNSNKNDSENIKNSDENINRNLGTIIVDFADRDFIKKIYSTNFSTEFSNQTNT